MSAVSIKIECVGCHVQRDVGVEQTDTPMCQACGMPMIAVAATVTLMDALGIPPIARAAKRSKRTSRRNTR